VKTARKQEPAASDTVQHAAPTALKKHKLAVLLITGDDTLWPQVGAQLSGDLLLKQVDSVDELISATQVGQPAIILWDARDHADPAAVLSRLQLHSARFAILVLDHAGSADAWTVPIKHRHVVAHVGLPIATDSLAVALESAHEEVNARVALLGEDSAAAPSKPSAPRRVSRPAMVLGVGLVSACVAIFAFTRHTHSPVKSASAPNTQTQRTAGALTETANQPSAGAEDKVDRLIEKAQQAMTDRHFIDPAEGSALSLYRRALLLDPANGEARQGLQRLSEILIARVQSALDERKFDVALQALETARSIDPGDHRLTALDARVTSLRAELGPAQIQAAMNAQNFDRATQLIDDAARAKTIGAAKLAALRDDMRRRREDFNAAHFASLIDARIQQERLIEPRNDSAAFYLIQARQAGVGAAALQSRSQELIKRMVLAARGDIEQHNYSDADRLVSELHNVGAPTATIAAVQHELAAARTQATHTAPAQPNYLELAQSRLAQGNVTDPDHDSALFYVNQLRSADPKNASLAQITGAVRAQILVRAHAALDASQLPKAEALLQLANGLGASDDLKALNEELAQKKTAATAIPEVAEKSLKPVKRLALEYPASALARNIEGWVEISFTVAADGSIANVKVLNSSPAGVFDEAATKAASRLRYKPVLQGGKAIAVATKLRIAFRISK